MDLLRDTLQRFKQIFSCEPKFLVTTPGRVNLLGEHTDYNDGFVLPVAIDRKIVLAIGPRDDHEIHLYAVDYHATVVTSSVTLQYDALSHWSNYPIGVLKMIQNSGNRFGGMNICYQGNIPIGSGLSSSAAVEVACTIAVTKLFPASLTTLDKIHLARRAEVEFVGVNCGIMDQFISMMGKKDHSMFLDCRTLAYEYLPFPKGFRIIVCDTGVKRELEHSAYNQRRRECQEAVQHFALSNPSVTALRDIPLDEFRKQENALDPVIRKRAAHVINENQRVLRAITALRKGEIGEFGKLMIDSHVSLRDLYEVSCRELDAAVDIAVQSEGVYGARMTGAGFGGSAICLVDERYLDSVVDRLRHEYQKRAGSSLTLYIAKVEDGAMVYDLQSLSLPTPAAQ